MKSGPPNWKQPVIVMTRERLLTETSLNHKSAFTLRGNHKWSKLGRGLDLRSVLVNQCDIPAGGGSYTHDTGFRQTSGRNSSHLWLPIQGRNPVHVTNAGSPSTSIQNLGAIRDVTLDKSPMSAVNVGESMLIFHPLINIREFTLGKSPTSAACVENLQPELIFCPTLCFILPTG